MLFVPFCQDKKGGESVELFCDLHIHSALSPCGDMDMTPNNIVGMSVLKGLDIIAITDHNTIGNVRAVMNVAKETELLVVPGMELETAEEAHFICLFKDIVSAESFYDWSKKYFNGIKNREEIFGEQIFMDEHDEIIAKEEQLLVSALSCSIYDAVPVVRNCGGVIIPAHVDKSSYSIISNLGIIPDDLNFGAVEISKKADKENVIEKYPYLKDKVIIKSSDSHYLGDIFETESMIDLKEKSISALFEYLKGGA